MDELSELEACRICVKCYRMAEMDFISLFHDNEEFQTELDFIRGEICQWKLKIEPEDGLPQRICADCFAKFCSIDAFRKECEMAQQKLLQSILNADKAEENRQQQQSLLGSSSSAIMGGNDVALNDYQVFEPQFDNFVNSPTPSTPPPPPLMMDSSATLLASNLITREPDNDMDFLTSASPTSQNLFSFETAEPPTTGTLPLETETETATPILDELMEGNGVGVGGAGGKHDLEDILRSSIIPTTTSQQQKCAKLLMMITSSSSEDVANTSDNECDDANVNKRLKGLPYTCHYCYCPDIGPIDHLSFPNEDALSQHFFDIHDPNRPYTCPHCSNSYKTQKLRDNHIRLNHELNKSKCNFCHKNLRGAADIHQFHCQHVGDWECDQCKEKFLNVPLHRFRLHQRQHDRGRHLKCSVCHRTFMRKANLEAHEKMHRNQVKTQWHCSPCKTNFLTNYDLRRHNYQHHDDETPVKCKECNQGFSSIAFMQRHIAQIHNNNNNNKPKVSNTTTATTTPQPPTAGGNIHICHKCNASFATLDSLQWHMELSNKNNGQCLSPDILLDSKERRRIQRQGVFPCFVCPKRFHLRSQLDKHLNTHDTRLRPFQCDQCYMRCRTAVELKQHVDVAHLNIKAFSCDKCGKCFGYKKDLRDHMLFHAEVNVHCTEEGCDYVCKNEKALNDHIRHKHRLLSCEYCREEFTRQKLTVLGGDGHGFQSTSPSSSKITRISAANITTTPSPLSSPTTNRHVFLTDHNSNNLTLNNFIANTSSNDLNLSVNADASNSMYVVTTATDTPVTASSINESDTNLDQYFMASLMDTEQEITVT
ncbi:zinc finger protein 567-like [Musca vetustissima]|uniref:zinc finger protein 567-like n=1 Tax=Musca vetustissima TaxID=27455 RepID=UPI002AB6A308|nr:zinc finger protein 567-like [Musca vetustissima]